MTPPNWLICTIQLTRVDGVVTAADTVTGARGDALTVPGALALLGTEMEARYHQLRATARWPHEQRALARLAKFYEEAP
jgi:hypothetical protein